MNLQLNGKDFLNQFNKDELIEFYSTQLDERAKVRLCEFKVTNLEKMAKITKSRVLAEEAIELRKRLKNGL